jgi:hypothetical protein
MRILLYVGPVFSFGNPVRRTQLFRFYDKGWMEYADYLGPKPSDPLNWVQRNRDASTKPYTYNKNKGFYLCPNSSDLRKYNKGILRLIIEAGADGVFFDGPMFKGGMCYCDHCKSRFRQMITDRYSASWVASNFREEGGIPIPTSNSDKLWRDWQTFFAESLTDYLDEMNGFAKSLRADFIITANYYLDSPQLALVNTAENIELWSKSVDLVFAESDYGKGPYSEAGRKYSNSYLYKYLSAAAHNKPVAFLRTSAPATTQTGESNLTKLCIAEALANHGTWQFAKLSTFAQKAAIQYNQFIVKNADLFSGWANANPVAILSSPKQVYYGFNSQDAGVSRYLSDNMIFHDIVVDEDMKAAYLSRYELLIIPESPVMSDNVVMALKTYVENGGHLLVFGESGKFDLQKRQRPEGSLAKVLTKDRALSTEIKKVPYGKGGVVYHPFGAFPIFARESLNTGVLASIASLPDLLNWLLNIDAHSSKKTHVEVNMMATASHERYRYGLHMVNYAVERNGAVGKLSSLKIRIRLPNNSSARSIRIFSPDSRDDSRELKFTTSTENGLNYMVFNVPELYIYNLIVFDN